VSEGPLHNQDVASSAVEMGGEGMLDEALTADAVNASSSIPGVTWLMVTPGSRRYALIVFDERPSAASLLPKASTACSRRSGLGRSRSGLVAVFVILLDFTPRFKRVIHCNQYS